ncbi:hypothetical protein INR49_009305, partial [Caranx melampygus]
MDGQAMNQNGHTGVHRPVAGIFLENTKKKITIYQAMKKRLLKPGTALALLEAQAATGGIIDPINNKIVPVEDAVKQGVVGPEMKEKLLKAEQAITGYVDPYTEQTISGYYEKDLLNNQMSELKVFYDPTSQENLNYQSLLEKCTVEPGTDLLLLPVCITFRGLRKCLSSIELFDSKIIDKETFDDLQKGKITTKEVLLRENVKEYLQGSSSIAGIAILSTNQKMSIYEAMKQRILMPGTALVLLEAQAATGFMIDPIENKTYTVDEAIKNKLVGPEYHAKLHSAERAVTGYKDPYTGETISLFQALSKDLIVKDHGIRLLEAQIATGGIIDPINSHRLPTEVAFKRGFFNEEMNTILEDSGDDTRDKSGSLNFNFIDFQSKKALKETKVKVTCGKYMGMTVSLWELLMSEYFEEQERQNIIQMFREGKYTISMIIKIVMEVIEKSVKTTKVVFEGIRECVTANQLVEAEIISKEVLEDLKKGKTSVKEVMDDENVNVYLQGESSIAGVLLPNSQIMTIYQAKQKGKLMPGTALILLEAQAATGFIIDPIGNRKFSVDDAVKAKILMARCVTDPSTGLRLLPLKGKSNKIKIDDNLRETFKTTVTVKYGRFKGKHITLWDLINSEYLSEDKRQEFLKLFRSRKITIEQLTITILEIIEKKEIKQQEELNFKGLRGEVSVMDLRDLGILNETTYNSLIDGKLTSTDVLKLDSVRDYLQGKSCVGGVILQPSNQKLGIYEAQKIGILAPGTALCLLEAQAATGFIVDPVKNKKLTVEQALRENIIGPQMYEKLLSAERAVTGYTDPYTGQKISLFQALKKDLIVKQHGIRLLEAQIATAQAATGWVIDPLKNKFYTVDEAVGEKVIGPDVHENLLSAERAVTGYQDPYTDANISLFEAMKEQLLQRSDGSRLLEAQIATGGIIDPNQSHRLPVHIAIKKGYLDEETGRILSNPTDDAKGFFDPNTKENISYLQLIKQCEKDAKTGLLLLPLYEEKCHEFHTDDQIELAFKNKTIAMNAGKFQNKSVTLWEVLVSEYISEQKRKQLIQQYKTGAMKVEEIIEILTAIITEVSSKEKKFKGLRKRVTASELYESQIISQELFTQIIHGEISVDKVNNMESIQKYLGATNCIAGVRVESTKKVMSIYEARSKGLLTPGTSLVLLEAQAATGFVIDPVNNKKLSVEEAVAQGVVGSEWKNKLLSAERAVTGYKDPYTGDIISLFQALKKDLIVKDHGIRLLEAQIATGGIIDPVHSHRVPVQVAYQRGYFDEEMNQILSDPDDDTKGFFDPNTQENLTYLQLVERCVIDPITGLNLLSIVKKGEFYFFVDEATKLILKSTTTTKAGGKYQGTTVSLWDLLYSKYITEEKRRELVQQYKSGTITIERLLEIILEIIQHQTQMETKTTSTITTITTTETSENPTFSGIRKDVSATELLESQIITEDLYKDLSSGKITVTEVSEMDSIRKYLEGTNSIAGVYLQSTEETLSIYEAKSKGLLKPGTSLVLLEAQAATGFVIDPVNNKKLSVEEAVAQGVVGNEWKNKLLSAERAVTGYKDPYTGKTISLFQALKKDLIVKDHGIRLLEAQIATGGIIDPVHSHRVPVQVAYERGYFDEEMNQILSDPDDDTKGFFDPNTQENLTYLQLVERCFTDPITGFSLLVIVKKGEFYFFVDEATKLILKSTTTTKAGGKFQGTTVSLWDLLYSKYITEEKRREIVQQYKSGSITIERLLEIILEIIQHQTQVDTKTTSTTITTTTITETSEALNFCGIRKDVSATELLESQIITEDLYKDLSSGKITATEVSEMDSVRKYLEGTNSIAGVYLQSTEETLSIYEAKSKGLLKPGTSLVLLEAQAATGFVIDPVNNKKLSVEEAVAQGVVGNEWKNKLLSAERAVTGYKDPYTGKTISLFQALKKDLIVKDHGIRLLEAQIATGGIIDPVHSHRVPVQVAYERGYFDEEMNQILSDPDDDTKGFFDPNTQENLTYLQLVERCFTDPITGFSLLVIVKKGEFYFFVDEATKLILKSTTTTKAGGKFQGTTVSLWDLLYSKYITEEKRRELVQQYKSGSITIERLLEIILEIIQHQTQVDTKTTSTTITTTTITETSEALNFCGIRKDVSATELLESQIITEDLYKDLSSGKITATEVSEMDSVRKYLEGTNSIAGVYLQSTEETLSIYEAKSKGLLKPGTSLVLLEAQAATGFVIDPVNNKKLSVEEAVAQGVVGNEWKNKLLSAERAVTGYKDPYTGKTISLVPVQVAYERGYFDEEMNQILSDPDDDTKGFFDPNTQENLTYLQLVERCFTDPITGFSL